jgi:flagellar M-ring protein FliF
MLLAERGLPSSNTAGYELFDQVGSLGLTSFMQEVTRVRALEGEIARTIQSINGISAARVHIVMADRGNFRRGEQQPSASVMVRTGTTWRRARPIRSGTWLHPPSLASMLMKSRCLTRPAKLLATGDDFSNSNLNRSLSIVQLVQGEVETNIEKALAPFLGIENFRASVTPRSTPTASRFRKPSLIPNPASSGRPGLRVKTRRQRTNSATETPATVEQNIPDQGPAQAAQPVRNPANWPSARKSRPTTKSIRKVISTVRNSYTFEGLSIAVVVNRARIADMLWWIADRRADRGLSGRTPAGGQRGSRH